MGTCTEKELRCEGSMADRGDEANSTVDRGDEPVIFDGDAHGTPLVHARKRALSQSTRDLQPTPINKRQPLGDE
jgi:hypothetical protein